MRRILSAADAKNRLADALRQAESSDLVLITRYRKPVAALQPSDMYGSIYHLSSAGTLKKRIFWSILSRAGYRLNHPGIAH